MRLFKCPSSLPSPLTKPVPLASLRSTLIPTRLLRLSRNDWAERRGRGGKALRRVGEREEGREALGHTLTHTQHYPPPQSLANASRFPLLPIIFLPCATLVAIDCRDYMSSRLFCFVQSEIVRIERELVRKWLKKWKFSRYRKEKEGKKWAMSNSQLFECRENRE